MPPRRRLDVTASRAAGAVRGAAAGPARGLAAAVFLLLVLGMGPAAAQEDPPDQVIILPDGLPLQLPQPPGLPEPGAVPPAADERGRSDNVILVPSPFVTVDWDMLYQRSAWGERVARDVAAEIEVLSEENRRIADALTAEESALTEKRGTMAHGAFRALADAFDARVTEIRRAQDARSRAIAESAEDERESFFEHVLPHLDEMLYRRGAVAVLDRRAVIRAAREIDVTEDLLELVDLRLGDGSALQDDADTAPLPDSARGNGASTDAPDAGAASSGGVDTPVPDAEIAPGIDAGAGEGADAVVPGAD